MVSNIQKRQEARCKDTTATVRPRFPTLLFNQGLAHRLLSKLSKVDLEYPSSLAGLSDNLMTAKTTQKKRKSSYQDNGRDAEIQPSLTPRPSCPKGGFYLCSRQKRHHILEPSLIPLLPGGREGQCLSPVLSTSPFTTGCSRSCA